MPQKWVVTDVHIKALVFWLEDQKGKPREADSTERAADAKEVRKRPGGVDGLLVAPRRGTHVALTLSGTPKALGTEL